MLELFSLVPGNGSEIEYNGKQGRKNKVRLKKGNGTRKGKETNRYLWTIYMS